MEFIFGKRKEQSFSTRLSQESCVQVLKLSIPHLVRSNVFGIFWSAGIYGRLKGSDLVLWYKPNAGNNSWNSFYYGSIEADTKGALIRGYFDINRWVKVFISAWIIFALLIGLGGSIALYAIHGLAIVDFAPLGWSILMVGFASLICRYGVWLGERQQPHVIEFIKNTIAATQL